MGVNLLCVEDGIDSSKDSGKDEYVREKYTEGREAGKELEGDFHSLKKIQKYEKNPKER